MEREEIVSAIRNMMPDLTDGAFDVVIQSDDGGTHVSVYIEEDTDGQKLHRIFFDKFGTKRILIIKCPIGYLHSGPKLVQNE